MEKAIIKNENVGVILPLYLFEHGGITIRTSRFDCQWDSGQVGFIFVSKEMIRKEYGTLRITKEIIDRVTKVLQGEVGIYDQYLTGDVYGYKISKITTCSEGHEHLEILDSCWGFYGMTEVVNESSDMLNGYLKQVENLI
jgi:hypothetical protein